MTTPAIQFCRQCSAIDDGLAQSSCSTFFQYIDFLEVREASYRYPLFHRHLGYEPWRY